MVANTIFLSVSGFYMVFNLIKVALFFLFADKLAALFYIVSFVYTRKWKIVNIICKRPKFNDADHSPPITLTYIPY